MDFSVMLFCTGLWKMSEETQKKTCECESSFSIREKNSD